MQAAHDAGQVPLVVRDVFHRCVGIRDAGIEEDVQVDAGSADDPEEVPAQRAEPGERIVLLAECKVEQRFGAAEQDSKEAFQGGSPCLQISLVTSRVAIRG
jgi:hypothetical protein